MGTQKLVCGLFLCFLAFNCFTASGSRPKKKLVTEDVNVIRHVSKQLGKTNWDFSVDPCSGKGNWARPSADEGFQSYVECNCSFHNNTACHVISIVSKSENLFRCSPARTSQAPSFSLYIFSFITILFSFITTTYDARIPQGHVMETAGTDFIHKKDLSCNFPSGTVPSQWATMRLEGLSLMGNRLSGPFLEFLTKITTLEILSIEANRFSGTVPPELGN